MDGSLRLLPERWWTTRRLVFPSPQLPSHSRRRRPAWMRRFHGLDLGLLPSTMRTMQERPRAPTSEAPPTSETAGSTVMSYVGHRVSSPARALAFSTIARGHHGSICAIAQFGVGGELACASRCTLARSTMVAPVEPGASGRPTGCRLPRAPPATAAGVFGQRLGNGERFQTNVRLLV